MEPNNKRKKVANSAPEKEPYQTFQEDLKSLITQLDNSTTNDQLYDTLLKIRSEYSNNEDMTIPGKQFVVFKKNYKRKIKAIKYTFSRKHPRYYQIAF